VTGSPGCLRYASVANLSSIVELVVVVVLVHSGTVYSNVYETL